MKVLSNSTSELLKPPFGNMCSVIKFHVAYVVSYEKAYVYAICARRASERLMNKACLGAGVESVVD